MNIEIPLLEEHINKEYHSEEFLFPGAPLEEEENPWKEMAHKIVKEEPMTF
jgi:hypothetical protein